MLSIPSPCVVDTNVGIVANGGASHMSLQCELVCVEALETITSSGRIAVDNGDLIFDEYRQNLSLAGQPGVGDIFMKWVHDHMWDETRCIRVPLTLKGDSLDFLEFPSSRQLATFDRSDRKFVAVAAACPENAPILNAADSDWKEHESNLLAVGILVIFLCPHELK